MTDGPPQQFTSSSDQWEQLKPLAREMRQSATLAENALWTRIRSRQLNGAKFRRQHAIDHFIVDFVCLERHLIIELDGEIHDLPDQQAYDVERQSLLEGRGFRVLRFANRDVLEAIDSVLDRISAALAE
jgi:very-short-patch-repair endonuclease